MKLSRTDRFKKDYQKLPQRIQKQTNQKLAFLLQDIRHPSLRVKKLKGEYSLFELSITMNYRLLFTIEDEAYVLRRIGTHTDMLGR